MIDYQSFGRIAIALAKMLVITFSDLAKVIHNSYHPKLNLVRLTRIINVHSRLQGTHERLVLQLHWSDITKA